MQDDLVDAVNWAIKNKIADPKKIAIMGAGYGGYAALSGLACQQRSKNDTDFKYASAEN